MGNLAITEKNDVKAHGFVIIIRGKLIFGKMTEVHKDINSSCWK